MNSREVYHTSLRSICSRKMGLKSLEHLENPFVSIFIRALIMVPLEVLAAFGLLWWNIDLPILFSYAVLIFIIPTQPIFSR